MRGGRDLIIDEHINWEENWRRALVACFAAIFRGLRLRNKTRRRSRRRLCADHEEILIDLIGNSSALLNQWFRFAFFQIGAVETISSSSSALRSGTLNNDVAAEPDHCVWYGVCNTDGSLKRYCPVNHTAKAFPEQHLDVITENCGHLLEHRRPDGSLNLCCNQEMVRINFKFTFTVIYLIEEISDHRRVFPHSVTSSF